MVRYGHDDHRGMQQVRQHGGLRGVAGEHTMGRQRNLPVLPVSIGAAQYRSEARYQASPLQRVPKIVHGFDRYDLSQSTQAGPLVHHSGVDAERKEVQVHLRDEPRHRNAAGFRLGDHDQDTSGSGHQRERIVAEAC